MNKTCKNCDSTKLWIVVYIQQHTTTEGAMATEREREGEYTYCMPYLSPPPYSRWTRQNWTQLRYQTLQGREKGATKEMKNHNPTTQTTERSRFKPQTNKKRTTLVRLVTWDSTKDEPRAVVYIQQHTTTESAVATEKERDERVHLLLSIVVTAPVFQFDTSWLNAAA